MQNGVYTIASGAVAVEFKGDEGNTNLPYVYVSHIAMSLGAQPDGLTKVILSVVDASGFEIVIAKLDVERKDFLFYEFATRLPLAVGESLKIVYPNLEEGEIKIRVFHTYRI